MFNISKHGLGPDEILKLKIRDVDLERGAITVPTSKLGAQRTIKLDKKCHYLLRDYVNRKGLTKPDGRLFGSDRKIKEAWRKYRERAFE